MSDARQPDRLSPDRQALAALRKLRVRLEEVERQRTEPIAIVGMACRFPGAPDVESFWKLLRGGVSAIREVPADRWDIDRYYDPNPDEPGKMNTRHAGFLDRIDLFEPQFFGISPREAVAMDPQQRLLLEVAWEALESAGQAPDALMGSKTGVFVGITAHDYAERQLKQSDIAAPDVYYGTGNALSCAVGRVSYVLGLVGPNIAVDTACSASLVSLHLAVQSLRNDECRLALVGGVNLILSPDVTVNLCRARMLAPDGRCKTFDAAADGYVRGEGCGMVVLKRLSDAVADGDEILALVRGTAVNQDGRSSGFTAPNELSQQALIRDALANGGVEASRVSYVEAHGTGTPLGDPIEIQALGAVLCQNRNGSPLTVGSVKTNIGHLESAAGIAGLIKVVLALRNREIPAHLNFTALNPHIAASEVPISIPTTTISWPPDDQPRVAGVSSFGFSGTNAHAIVEEAPAPASISDAAPASPHLLALSAKSDESLRQLVSRYADRLAVGNDSIADICRSAATGRSHFDRRFAAVARTRAELQRRLKSFASNTEIPGVFHGTAMPAPGPDVAFLFTGQGSQYAGMARTLYETESVFRSVLDRCDEILASQLDRRLLDLLYGAPDEGTLNQTAYAQPALFAIEYALAELWRSWGVEPAMLVGHSLGEYVAACVAGVFSLEDALTLVAARGRLMQRLPPDGAMAAVGMAPARVAAVLAAGAPSLTIAAVNGPQDAVISGPAADVDRVIATLTADGIECHRLSVSHAFHSPLLDPMLQEFERLAGRVAYSAPRIGIVSNLTGELADSSEIASAGYWRRHARSTVQFHASLLTLRDQGCRVFLEIGPSPTLIGMARRSLSDLADAAWIPSLRKGQDDRVQMLEAVSHLYIRGVPLKWTSLCRSASGRKVALPTYPFSRSRYWIEESGWRASSAQPAGTPSRFTILGTRLRAAIPTFEARISPASAPILGSHRVGGRAVVPAAAYIDIWLSAASELFGDGSHVLEGLSIEKALVLDDARSRTVQCVARIAGDEASIQLFSLDDSVPGADTWTLHASGSVRRSDTEEMPSASFSLDEARKRCARSEPALLYASLTERGIAIDHAHQSIQELCTAPGEAVARVALWEEKPGATKIGSAVLDACMLVVGAAVQTAAPDVAGTLLISSTDRVVIRHGSRDHVWVHVSTRKSAESANGLVIADLLLFDDEGRQIGELSGIGLTRARIDTADAVAPADWFYDVRWVPATPANEGHATAFLPAPDRLTSSVKPTVDQTFAQAGVADHELLKPLLDELVGAYVCDALRCLGWAFEPGQSVEIDQLFSQLAIAGRYRELFERLVDMLVEDEVVARAGRTCVVLRQPLALDPLAGDRLRQRFAAFGPQLSLTIRCGEQLAAVLSGSCDPLELLFPGGSFSDAEAVYKDLPLAKAFNRLLGSTVAAAVANLPSGRSIRVLEIGAGTGASTASMLEALPTDRCEYVFTDLSKLFIARAEHRFRAHRCLRGQLLDIEADPIAQGFTPHSFDIVVAANVLHATADLDRTFGHLRRLMAPGGLLLLMEATRSQRWIDLTFGLTEGWWKFTDRSLRPSHPLLTRARWSAFLTSQGFDAVSMLPASSDTEAVPEQTIVAARAPHGPSAAARRDSSERDWIVIDDGSGLGRDLVSCLAARGARTVYLSAPEGLVVADLETVLRPDREVNVVCFCIGGPVGELSPERALQAAHVLLRAAGNVRAKLWLVTHGAQPAGQDSAKVRPFQTPVWGLGRVISLEHPELWGGLIDLDPGREGPAQIPDVLPIIEQADDEDQFALRNGMTLVPRIERSADVPRASIAFDAGAAYLVTGGLGSLGLKVANWMAREGAKHLVLIGRRPPAEQWQLDALAAIEAMGVSVLVVSADVTDEQAMREALQRATADRPLKGVLHLATLASSVPVAGMTGEALTAMLQPKVKGTRILHELTADHPLDFFVMFSSTTALWGVAGLGHYAAANQFLDAFARYRHGLGLKATAINWGTWDDVRGTSIEDRQRFVDVGLKPMPSMRALASLSALIASNTVSKVVAAVDWTKFKAVYESRRRRPFFDRVSPAVSGEIKPLEIRKSDLPRRLAESAPSVRRDLVTELVQSEVARVMGLGTGTAIDPAQGLFEMGMDSLMSVELRSRLEASLDRKLPSTLTFNYPNIGALVNYLLAEAPQSQAAPKGTVPSKRPAETKPDVPRDRFSEDDLEQMLADKLRSLR